jgi:UDP-N-acetylmuramoylalanine--D-glutamate ligase
MNASGAAFGAGERALVVGLGRSGLASCRVLHARGAIVYATDEKAPAALTAALAQLPPGVRFVEPAQIDAIAAELTSAVLSPGVPVNGALVRRIGALGIPVYSEIEVAYRLSQAPLVAVTGTKGKTTTTALLGAMFRRAGKVTHVGGNIGNALINETAAAASGDWVVAEVSSFQLESIRSFKPRIAAILNISPDHLDRYHSMDEYAEAKFRIFANQGPDDAFVGNLDDPLVSRLTAGAQAKRLRSRAFWFALGPHALANVYCSGDRIVYAASAGSPRPSDIMPLAEIGLRGAHNVANVLGALLAGLAAGLDPEALRAAVRDFKPLPHRLQRVAQHGGVTYVDDSKATNPGAVIAALGAFDVPVVLIAGGRAKGTDFRDLGAAIDRRAKAVVLIGEAAAEIGAAIARTRTYRAASMDEAVRIAQDLAQPGDAVLLSPGCASFDMFESAEARGDAFARAALPAVAARG